MWVEEGGGGLSSTKEEQCVYWCMYVTLIADIRQVEVEYCGFKHHSTSHCRLQSAL